MKNVAWILLISAVSAMAYPMGDAPEPLLDNPNLTSLNHEWLTSTSFLFNQLKSVSQTPLVPAPVAAAAKTPVDAPPVTAPTGFQYDLNLDGKLDEFLPLTLPPLLGASYSTDQSNTSRISSKLFALTLPSFSTTPGDGAPTWLEALSLSQNTYIVDASAMARGQAGLTGKAQWSVGKTASPAPSPSAPKLTRAPAISILWLALIFGGCLLVRQRRLSRHPINS